MSQDITLYPQRNLPAAPEDLWGPQGQQSRQLGSYTPQNGQQQPLKRLHRLLRGRWLLAIILSAAGAVGGALAGWKSQLPLYAGVGVIEIKPWVPNLALLDKTIPYFDKTLRSEAMKIMQDRMISAALQRPEWLSAGGKKNPTKEYIAVFQNNLTAEVVKDSQLIRVTFVHEDPKIAAAGANALINAYEFQSGVTGSEQNQRKLILARQNFDKESQAKLEFRGQIDALTRDFGSSPDLGPRLSAMQERYDKAKWELDLHQLALDQAKLALPDAKGNVNVAPLTMDQVAQVDTRMKGLLDNVQQAKGKLDQNIQLFGPNHPAVLNSRVANEIANKEATDYYQMARKTLLDIAPTADANGLSVVTPQTIVKSQQKIEMEKTLLAGLNKQISELGKINQQVHDLQQKISFSEETCKNLEININSLEASGALSGQVIIQGNAVEPISPAIDKRKQVALAGIIFGGGLPFGILLLIGLLDSRYRYSEEAGEAGVHGLTLLGILPNLPDRLSDPGQASIAAHCVHQIRTMLQINSHEDKRAFSVTSSSSGDGKTSLTLALGLSFAASGSRTLLIDSDLVGAGLTARLGMNGPEGILEAMTNGNLLDYVKNTDVSDLSILPVGLAQLHHAGIFSPQAVRKLVNEAKKHFEIILIDTGPILGSIEATPVAAASDGVILTVARGQQRPLVEKALAHLRSIGARIAGVVFNRAQARDFEQSVSGISLRSAARNQNGNGHSRVGQAKDSGQYGPVARAVASSVKGNETKN